MTSGTRLHQYGNGQTAVRRMSEAIASFNFITTKKLGECET